MGSMSFSMPSMSRSSTPGGSADCRVESSLPTWRRGGAGPWLRATPPSEVVPEVGGGIGPGAVGSLLLLLLVVVVVVAAVVVGRANGV